MISVYGHAMRVCGVKYKGRTTMDRLGRKVIYFLMENKPMELTAEEEQLLQHRFLHVFPLPLEINEKIQLEVENGVLVASVFQSDGITPCPGVGKYTFAKCDLDSLKTLFEMTCMTSEG